MFKDKSVVITGATSGSVLGVGDYSASIDGHIVRTGWATAR